MLSITLWRHVHGLYIFLETIHKHYFLKKSDLVLSPFSPNSLLVINFFGAFLLLSWILVTTKHPGAVTQKHAEWGTCSTDIVSWRSEVEVRVRVTVSPSTREAEAGRSLWVHRPAWLTEWVPAYPGLHKETVSGGKNVRTVRLLEIIQPCVVLFLLEFGTSSYHKLAILSRVW